eukprot:843444-Rhodomonas_salina.2
MPVAGYPSFFMRPGAEMEQRLRGRERGEERARSEMVSKFTSRELLRRSLQFVLLAGLGMDLCAATAFCPSFPLSGPSPRLLKLSKGPALAGLTMQRRGRGGFQRGRGGQQRGRTGYGPDLSTDFVRRESRDRDRPPRPWSPIPGDRRRGKVGGPRYGERVEHGYMVKGGQLPKDLHTVNDLDVLIDILETVAGVSPIPPTFPAPQSRPVPSPPSRAPQDPVLSDPEPVSGDVPELAKEDAGAGSTIIGLRACCGALRFCAERAKLDCWILT